MGGAGRHTGIFTCHTDKGNHRSQWHLLPGKPLTSHQSEKVQECCLGRETAKLMGLSVHRMKGFLEMRVKI